MTAVRSTKPARHAVAAAVTLLMPSCNPSDTSSDKSEVSNPMSAGRQHMNAELGREASRIEELQVQPPLAIDYKPAGPGDIRIKPESVICGALNFEKPLRDRLGLRRDVSVRGSVNGAFQRTIKLSNLSSFKTSKGLRRFNGVFQASNSMQLEYYYDRCR